MSESRRTLPGSDKYRQTTDTSDAPWNDPLVLRANTEVPVTDVLNTYFGMHVPVDAERWKTYCPLAREHEDGGIDKQFRVFTSTNSGYCYAMHGGLDPIRLWRLRRYFPTMRDAAENLLDTYGIEHRTRPYWERMRALTAPVSYHADPDAVVQAINVFLAAEPGYAARQYDPEVLSRVNLILSEVHEVCTAAHNVKEVAAWLETAKSRMTSTLRGTSPTSKDG